MRLARLPQDNRRTQGAERRAWYRRNSPEHLRQVAELVEDALRARQPEAPNRAVVLGAGAATELPLGRLARATEAVTLVDVDVAGMGRAREELPAALRDRIEIVRGDVTGGVSDALATELRAQPWADLVAFGGPGGLAPLDAAAAALDRTPVPDPPRVAYVEPGTYGVVIGSFVLTQLFSLPLLDVLDTLTVQSPGVVDRRDEHPRYVTAAAAFRRRIALAHLSLIASLLAPGGAAVLASDQTGYLLPAHTGPHVRDVRESFAVLPPDVLAVPADLEARFTPVGPVHRWEWLVSAPQGELPGRLYDAFGVVLRARTSPPTPSP